MLWNLRVSNNNWLYRSKKMYFSFPNISVSSDLFWVKNTRKSKHNFWPTRKIKNNISNTNNNGKIWAHKHIYRRTHTWTHKSHHHLKRKRFFSYSDQQHKNRKIIFFFVFHVFSIAQTEIDIENHLEIDLKYKFGQANIQQLGQFSFNKCIIWTLLYS